MSYCTCPDMMHLVPNALKDFLLFVQKYEHKTDVDKVLLTAFQRVGVNLQSIDGGHLSWYIPSCVTNHMKSFVRRMKLPKDHLLNGAMIISMTN